MLCIQPHPLAAVAAVARRRASLRPTGVKVFFLQPPFGGGGGGGGSGAAAAALGDTRRALAEGPFWDAPSAFFCPAQGGRPRRGLRAPSRHGPSSAPRPRWPASAALAAARQGMDRQQQQQQQQEEAAAAVGRTTTPRTRRGGARASGAGTGGGAGGGSSSGAAAVATARRCGPRASFPVVPLSIRAH